jgi:Ca-activated chloride channel family protein
MKTYHRDTAYLVIVLLVVSGCGGTGDPSENNVMDWLPTSADTGEMERHTGAESQDRADQGRGPGQGGDRYAMLTENAFTRVSDQALSTFSIDVDTASYTKTRMYLLEHGILPPPDAVRIEEFINYFDYDYSGPAGEHPFAVHLEAATAPWRSEHRLVRFALKGKEIHQDRPPCNLVFLLDVSGSMDYANKLPLVKQGMCLLASQLSPQDLVSIVVYAGAAGLARIIHEGLRIEKRCVREPLM